MSKILEIAESLKRKCEETQSELGPQIAVIIQVASAYVETGTLLIGDSASQSDKILRSMLDEIFIDANVACLLAAGGQHKSACVIARSIIEIGLYFIYFVDHRIECMLWANAEDVDRTHDMSFTSIRELVCRTDYMMYASLESGKAEVCGQIKNDLAEHYRTLSQRVHGKYTSLLSASQENASKCNDFFVSTEASLKALLHLIKIRTATIQDLNG